MASPQLIQTGTGSVDSRQEASANHRMANCSVHDGFPNSSGAVVSAEGIIEEESQYLDPVEDPETWHEVMVKNIPHPNGQKG